MSQDAGIGFLEKPFIWMVIWHQDVPPDAKNILSSPSVSFFSFQ